MKIQNLSESKKEYTTQFIYSSTCKSSKINRLGIRGISFCLDNFWVKARKIAKKNLEKDTGYQKINIEKGKN